MKQNHAADQLLQTSATRNITRTDWLGEQEILDLQDYFLTPGFHFLKTTDPETGRELLTQFIQVLQYHYADVAVLSTSKRSFSFEYHDLYKELMHAKGFNKKEALEKYLLDSFYYDLVVIEGTKELLASHWFGRFENLLNTFAITEKTPVVLLYYDAPTL